MISSALLSKGLKDSKISVMNFLNEITIKYPHAISFAPGRPPEKIFDVERSLGYIAQYLGYTNDNGKAMNYSSLGQYGNTKGIISELICKLIENDEGIIANKESIVATVGCQEAMCLCLLALAANDGDVVLVESPSYVGIVGAAKLLGIEIIGVPTNENGVDLSELCQIVEDLERQNKKARLLYVSPDFSNPTGFTSSLEQRKKLLELTRELNIIVLEDHAYNYFYFGEDKHKCLKSLPKSEHVIYLGSFSKSIYPGLRVGFLVADQKVSSANGLVMLSDEISKIKSFISVNSSPITQAIAGGLIIDKNYSLISHTKLLRDQLRENRNEMLKALSIFFPKNEGWCKSVTWNTPEGGFFMTVSLPFAVTDADLYQCVEEYGVIWTPMKYFYIEDISACSVRLSFSYVTPTQIQEGIKALSLFVKSKCINGIFINEEK